MVLVRVYMGSVFRRISIQTRLSAEQAGDVVRELIRPEEFLGGLAYAPDDPRPFIGRSKKNHFEFRRRSAGQGSFVPVIIGRVQPTEHGADFNASIRPHLLLVGLFPLLFGLLGYEAVVELLRYSRTSGATGGYGLLIFFILFGGFGVVSYRFESRKAERILREAFEHKGYVS